MQIESGLGVFVPAVFPLPFNPIIEAISPKPGMGVFVPASFPVPFNPIVRELSGCGVLKSPFGCRPDLGMGMLGATAAATATPGIMDTITSTVAQIPGGWITVVAVLGVGAYFMIAD